jgi:hypothetical protein
VEVGDGGRLAEGGPRCRFVVGEQVHLATNGESRGTGFGLEVENQGWPWAICRFVSIRDHNGSNESRPSFESFCARHRGAAAGVAQHLISQALLAEDRAGVGTTVQLERGSCQHFRSVPVFPQTIALAQSCA